MDHRNQVFAGVFTVVLVLSAITAPVAGLDTPTDNPTQSANLTEADRIDSDTILQPANGVPIPPETSSTRIGETGSRNLQPALQAKLSKANTRDKVPVIAIFKTRPRQEIEKQRIEKGQAKETLTTLAQNEQDRAKSYLDQQQARNRAGNVRTLWSTNSLAVEATPRTIRQLSTLPNVETIVYDRKIRPANAGLEPFSGILSQYGNTTTNPSGFDQKTTGDRVWGVEYIGADAVHERGVNGEGINVSVVDTGIDDSHPALNNTVVNWKDFTADNYTSPVDPGGHGTHVAGTIAGRPDGTRAVGVAPGANLYGAKVFSENPNEHPTRVSDLVEAFEWSANNGADVISASVGVPPIYELLQGTTSTGSDATGETTAHIYDNASGLSSTASDSHHAYKPAYVMVIVEPIAVDGSTIQSDETREAVMQNLSVTLNNPVGNQSLKGVSASWAFQNGEVPDEIAYRKYKPTESQTITSTGTWTLKVTSTTGRNVTYKHTISPVYPTNGSDPLADSINTVSKTHDVVSSTAAGNYGSLLGNRTVSSPGAAAEVITVGATGYRVNGPAPFSSRGPVGYGAAERSGVDLIAPGTDIVSAIPVSSTIDGQPPYGKMSGTSMATPHVSGAIALMLDAEPTLSPAEIQSSLRQTTQDSPVGPNAGGAGILDAYRAVNASNSSALGPETSETDRHTLFGGIGSSESNQLQVTIEPHRDSIDDAGGAPDIWLTSQLISENFELGTHDNTPPNATFRLYVDADRSNNTGDDTQDGSEYAVVMNRTFDGTSYNLSTRALAYNASTGVYEPTDTLRVRPGAVNSRYVELDQFDFTDRSDERPFDWHVTSAEDGSTPRDRFPNTGQTTTSVKYAINGNAVAWNATAGEPDNSTPITFRVYDPTGTIVANQTVQTNADGRATIDFPVNGISTKQNFTLEVTDTYGNTIRQQVRLKNDRIQSHPNLESKPAYTVEERNYAINQNETVDLNIPVFDESDGEMEPYSGDASIQVRNSETEEAVTINGLTVEDGIIKTTLDFGTLSIDETGTRIDIDVALSESFTRGSSNVDSGSISIISSGVVAHVKPHSTIVSDDEQAILSFQQEEIPGEQPTNKSFHYTVYWVSDRNVASLYRHLPSETVDRVKAQRQRIIEGYTPSPITGQHRAALQDNLKSLSAQGTITKVTRGSASPSARGVGTFDVTPPEDARYGIVTGYVNGSRDLGSMSTVFVKGQFEDYADSQTEPPETTRYDLELAGKWGTHTEGSLSVPNDNATVQIALRDTESGAYVDNETVKLYTTFGQTRTVQTDGDGPVTLTFDVSARDWRNLSYDQRHQEVLGVAVGHQKADGSPVSEVESLYGSVYERRQGVIPRPEMKWTGDGGITTELSYRNATTHGGTTGANTLIEITSTRGHWTARDIVVDFVNGTDKEVLTLNSTDSNPPSDDELRQYKISTQTGATSELTAADELAVNGLTTNISSPETIIDEQTQTISVRVFDRTSDAIQDAVVLWSHSLDPGGVSQSGESTIPRALAGDTLIASTNQTGVVTFNVSPDISELVLSRPLRYQVGVVTANTSQPIVERNTITVRQSNTSVTGIFEHPDTTPATGDLVKVGGTGQGGTGQTNATGGFDINVEEDNTYGVRYYQQDADGEFQPRDGVVDLYAASTVEITNSTKSIGTITLPRGNILDIQAVDEAGDPVQNATVTVTHVNDGVNATWKSNTDADGYLNASTISDTGLEINGTVRIKLTPPSDADRFKNQPISNVTNVTSDTRKILTLEEKPAVSGTIIYPNNSTTSGDTLMAFGSEPTDSYSAATQTDAQGSFRLRTPNASDVDVQFYQGNWTNGSKSTTPPRDGVVDLYAVDQINATNGPVTLENISLPAGDVLNVTVLNESGVPVQDASVTVTHYREDADASIRNMSTNADGKLVISNNNTGSHTGIELDGDASITVRPPEKSWRFNDTEYQENVTATNRTNLNITLNESNPPKTNVTLKPRSANATRNTTKTYDVVVTNASQGVGAFEAQLTLSNGTVGAITEVKVKGSADLSTVNINSEGVSATFDGALMNTSDTGRAVIATVAVKGATEGETALSLGFEALGTEKGEPYEISEIRNGSLNVETVPKLQSGYQGAPTDTDEDGVLEDINGDGELNIIDVQALYTTRERENVQSNTALFDINDDGAVDIIDIQALYIEQRGS